MVRRHRAALIGVQGPYRIGGTTWWLADRADPTTTRATLERVMAAVSRGDLADRKSGRRKALYEVQLAGPPGHEGEAPADHLLKHNRYQGAAALRRRLRGSKARTELARAERLAGRGLPTPVPLAAGETVRAGRLTACWLLMPIEPGVLDLRAHWEGPALPPAERRGLAEALGDLSRRALAAGLFQDDFAPNNVLVRPGVVPELLMIDFERARVSRRVKHNQAVRMMAKLQREMVGASAADQLRFLEAFAGGEARLWWRELADQAPKLLARDLAHLQRTLARPGRRFEPFREGSRRGWRRRSAVPGDVIQRELPAHEARRGREIFACAVLLDRRGLGPRPLAFWTEAEKARILWEQPVGAAGEAPEKPRRTLQRRLLAIAGLAGHPEAGQTLAAPSRFAESGALWLAPERLRITGNAAAPSARARWLDA